MSEDYDLNKKINQFVEEKEVISNIRTVASILEHAANMVCSFVGKPTEPVTVRKEKQMHHGKKNE